MKPSGPVARRYAKALHALAGEAGRAEAVADELSRFAGLLMIGWATWIIAFS